MLLPRWSPKRPFRRTGGHGEGRSWATRVITAALLVASLGAPQRAWGQSAPPLTGRDYSLDLFRGTVLGSTRVVGLGGAYAAIAEGSEGIRQNPAAAVNRPYFSKKDLDWTWHVDFLLGKALGAGELDFDNNGRSASGDSLLVTAGALLQYGSFGIGLTASFNTIDLGTLGGSDDRAYEGLLLDARISAGYAFFDHQLIAAGGLRIGSMSLRLAGSDTTDLFSVNVAGLEGGVLYRPRALPLRLGAAISVPFDRNQGTTCGDNQCPAGFFLPGQVTLPWELRVGAAFRLGAGRFNPIPDYVLEARKKARILKAFHAAEAAKKKSAASKPKASKSAATKPADGKLATSKPADAKLATSRPASSQPRRKRPYDFDEAYGGERYILIAAEVVVIGPSKNAIGPDGFVEQRRERVGEDVAVSVHLGVESEVWKRRLRVRLGSYWEPSRYRDRAGRVHGTASILLRLFDFSLWGHHSLSWAPSVDIAENYLNLSFLVSFWH